MPAKFTKSLRKEEVTEGATAKLHCELSKASPVEWRKGSVTLRAGDRVSLRQDGNMCELEIRGVAMEDAGEYSCVCGQERTSAMLTVRGKGHVWPRGPMSWCLHVVHYHHLLLVRLWASVCLQLCPPGNSKPPSPCQVFVLVSVSRLVFASPGLFPHPLCAPFTHSCCGPGQFVWCLWVSHPGHRVPKRAWSPPWLSPALPAKFTKTLRKEEATEGATAIMHCELSKAVPVEWRKGPKTLRAGDRVSLRQDGMVCELEIRELALVDTGEYSCVCGQERTSATLTVRDKNHL